MAVIAVVFAVLIALFDQIIKVWISNNISPDESREFIVIEGEKIINLTLHHNDGAVFGSMSGMRVLLIVLPIALICVCLWAIFAKKITKPFPVILMGAIMGGGLGNLIDRIFRGGLVTDYLDVQLFDFAIFNFADCFITVGCILMAIYMLFFDNEIFPNEKNVKTDASDLISVSSVPEENLKDEKSDE